MENGRTVYGVGAIPNTVEGESTAELLERLLAHADSYINDVVEVYEASERNYRAAMTAGTVVKGLSDTTNF